MPARASEARLGDEFEAIYEHEFGFVWRMLLHFGVAAHQAEDAAQEVFIVVHRRLPDWDRASSVRAWLYGICRRVAADHRRARTRHERKLQALPTPAAAPALEGRVADRELLVALDHALAELAPELREAFVLTELEGLSGREIAEATQQNPNTIASRLRKARAQITAAFARIAVEPTPNQGQHHARARS